MKNSFPLAQKMLPEIYSTVDMIMKGRPLLVLLLFAASAVILAGMYYAATREGTTTRQDKWAGVLSDLDACSRRKHVKSAQYDHFAGIARQEREHDAERLFRAMAHAERLQEYNAPTPSSGSAAATHRRSTSPFSGARPTTTCDGASTSHAVRRRGCMQTTSSAPCKAATAMRPAC